jgi:O-antigen/teichoic acid export membrane protein
VHSTYTRFAKNVTTIAIGNVFHYLSTILLLPILTKTLGEYYYGLWSQMAISINLFLPIVGLGLPFALVRFLPSKKTKDAIREDVCSVLFFVLATSAIFCVVIKILEREVAALIFDNEIYIISMTLIIFVSSIINRIYMNIYRAFRRMIIYSILTIVEANIQILTIIYLVYKKYSFYNVLLAYMVIKIIYSILLSIIFFIEIGFKKPIFKNIKSYLTFSLPLIPTSIATWLIASSDRYLIAYYHDCSLVGVYSASYVIGSIILPVASILNVVLIPTLSNLFDNKNLVSCEKILTFSVKYFLCIAIAFVAALLNLSEEILTFFSNGAISTLGHGIVPLIALSNLLYGIYIIFVSIPIIYKRTFAIGSLLCTGAFVNVALNIILIPNYKLVGAAVATFITYLGICFGLILYCRRLGLIRFNLIILIKIVISSLGMSIFIKFTSVAFVFGFIFEICLGLGIYIILLVMFKIISKQEFQFLINIVHKK